MARLKAKLRGTIKTTPTTTTRKKTTNKRSGIKYIGTGDGGILTDKIRFVIHGKK